MKLTAAGMLNESTLYPANFGSAKALPEISTNRLQTA